MCLQKGKSEGDGPKHGRDFLFGPWSFGTSLANIPEIDALTIVSGMRSVIFTESNCPESLIFGLCGSLWAVEVIGLPIHY